MCVCSINVKKSSEFGNKKSHLQKNAEKEQMDILFLSHKWVINLFVNQESEKEDHASRKNHLNIVTNKSKANVQSHVVSKIL